MDVDISEISGAIDRTSPDPYYMQLLRLIEAEIKSGRYKAGDRLPGETDLCRQFDLARSTVRETLRSLQDRGLIKIIPRRGPYVASTPPSGWLLQVSEGFFEEKVYHEHGHVETCVLRNELRQESSQIHAILGQATDKPIYVLERLRFLEGKSVIYSINYLLSALKQPIEAAGVVRGQGSLNEALRRAGYKIYGAHREVEAVAANEVIAAKLKVPIGTPLLLVTSKSWDKNNRVFDYYHAWLRSDVVKVSVIAKAAER